MENNFGRFLTIILAVALIITIIPFNAYAGEFSYSEIIKPKYDNARTFSEGLAAVKKDGKWGYIDEDENLVIDFKYDRAHSFSENKAVVAIKKIEDSWNGEYKNVNIYWGIIDRDDNYTPLVWDDGEKFHDSFFIEDYEFYEDDSESDQLYHNGMVILSRFDDPGRYMFDSKGKLALPYSHPTHAPTEGIVATHAIEPGYVDLKGNELFKDKNFAQTRPFNQGLAPVSFYDNDGNPYWTLMDTNGKLLNNIKFNNFIVKNVYSDYQVFGDNSLLSMSNFDGKWGSVNKEGKTIIPFKYEKLSVFNEGLNSFKRDGKYGFLDIYGNEVIKPQFDDASLFSNGIAVARQGENAYIIDKEGKKIEGTENVPKDSYFVENGHGGYTIYSPGKHVITKEDSKYGFGEIKYTPSLPTVDEMSDWALDEVLLAIENDLVPVNLQNMYRTDITRVDFAALVVEAIEEVVGEDINEVLEKETGKSLYEFVSQYPFKDTTDKNVIAAQALKIINGKGKGEFAPYDTITREEAAALLMRTAKFLGDETTLDSKAFSDHENVANYAKEAVNYVSSIDVMQGKANNNFAPKDTYTREQAYMTIYRLFDVLINK